jgi:hypothetical protein
MFLIYDLGQSLRNFVAVTLTGKYKIHPVRPHEDRTVHERDFINFISHGIKIVTSHLFQRCVNFAVHTIPWIRNLAQKLRANAELSILVIPNFYWYRYLWKLKLHDRITCENYITSAQYIFWYPLSTTNVVSEHTHGCVGVRSCILHKTRNITTGYQVKTREAHKKERAHFTDVNAK